jgi:hypothetical protein
MSSLEPLMVLSVQVAPPIGITVGPPLGRRFIPIIGGEVSGRYSGVVLAGGGDWQTIGADGQMEISAHYILDLAGATVEVRSDGLRHGPPEVLAALARGEAVDPSLYYFRTAMRFQTASPHLSRLNAILAVARGERLASTVRLTVLEVK